MATSSQSLTLGFVGTDALHRDNVRALLSDLIDAYHRDYRNAPIRFLIAVEPAFTDTLVELADYCLTSGHTLGLVGHDEFFEQESVKPFMTDALGNLMRLTENSSIHKGMAASLALYPFSRLIILGNPDEDDYVYASVVAARRKNILVQSLLDGLDKVVLETENNTEEPPDMPRPSDEEEDLEEEEFEEEEFDDEDLDDDEDVFVEKEEEEEEEEEDSEEIEDEDDLEESEDEDDVAEEDDDDLDEEEENDEEEEEDLADDDASEDEESEDEEEEEMPPTRKTAAPKTAAPKPGQYTEDKLNRLALRDKTEFYKVAETFGVLPGRGIKVAMVIDRILQVQSGEPIRTKKPAAPATKRAPTKKRPAKKEAVATAKKTATVRRPASTPSTAAARGMSKSEIDAIAAAVVKHLTTVLRRGSSV